MTTIIIAVTGASAQVLAERAIDLTLQSNHTIDLILSRGAYEVWNAEHGINIPIDPIKQEFFWRQRLDNHSGHLSCHKWNENAASIASGSYLTKGMIVIPCTMGTLGRIASGCSTNLIERCADVHLKEGRNLVISPRESPFNLIHLRNMTTLCESGAKIIPCIPAWYAKPKDLNEMIDFMVVRLFDSFEIEMKKINRWNG
ncbi:MULTISPECIES: flavin prenyltransferase UbiX [unclassified Prochlorococcus]|uniref:flavin prenyltransferase UbiX n=1 Tax=unclassified Prochlorococcus TaxID=2627481 RepID=UPI000533AB36|nr:MULTISPECIES: flavin prenyltransferase UbiX [unclassified Prochlorococcus]KGG15308.1 3-polyprenyl-4-hydroxybenzoate carboxy-lyase UbiX [Prochlorococcus sp. MIT 0602]KGG17587.1 3-polyprenyl-4-hydroxybenzoate carboxy-lyase UbiX [Prochlorococcus sp. MIT 0603]